MSEIVQYTRKSYYVGPIGKPEEIVAYQDVAIAKYAERNNFKVTQKFSGINFTGKNADRPFLQAFLLYLQHNNVSTVLFYSVDRLGRNNRINVDLIEEIIKSVNKVVFVKDGFEFNTDSFQHYFKAFFLLLSCQAEDANKQLSDKIIDSNDAKLEKKLFIGSIPPIGFTRRKEDGWLIPATSLNTKDIDEIEGFQILQLVFYSAVLGFSYATIGKVITERFVRNRKSVKHNVDHTTVREILSNPVYIGVLRGMKNDGTSYLVEEACIEPIISPTIFYLVNKIRERMLRGRKPSVLKRLPNFNLCYYGEEGTILFRVITDANGDGDFTDLETLASTTLNIDVPNK